MRLLYFYPDVLSPEEFSNEKCYSSSTYFSMWISSLNWLTKVPSSFIWIVCLHTISLLFSFWANKNSNSCQCFPWTLRLRCVFYKRLWNMPYDLIRFSKDLLSIPGTNFNSPIRHWKLDFTVFEIKTSRTFLYTGILESVTCSLPASTLRDNHQYLAVLATRVPQLLSLYNQHLWL